jgi:hypothetical protein
MADSFCGVGKVEAALMPALPPPFMAGKPIVAVFSVNCFREPKRRTATAWQRS